MSERIERRLWLPASPGDVWEVVTGADWLADDVALDLRPGGDASLPLRRRAEDRLGRGGFEPVAVCRRRRTARVLVGGRRRTGTRVELTLEPARGWDGPRARGCGSSSRARSRCSTWSEPHCREPAASATGRRWSRPEGPRPDGSSRRPCRRRLRCAVRPHPPALLQAIAAQPAATATELASDAADLTPGRPEAPERARGRRADRARARRPRGPLPRHARATVGRGLLDGRGRRAVGRAARTLRRARRDGALIYFGLIPK